MISREYEEKMKDMMIEEYVASGKVTMCPTRKAPGSNHHRTIMARSKKCMTHNTTSAPKMRLMNYEPVFNIPNPYNGCKMVMGNY